MLWVGSAVAHYADTSGMRYTRDIDGNLVFSCAQENGFEDPTTELETIFQDLLGRETNQTDIDFWSTLVNQGWTFDQIRGSIKGGEEYKALHPFDPN